MRLIPNPPHQESKRFDLSADRSHVLVTPCLTDGPDRHSPINPAADQFHAGTVPFLAEGCGFLWGVAIGDAFASEPDLLTLVAILAVRLWHSVLLPCGTKGCQQYGTMHHGRQRDTIGVKASVSLPSVKHVVKTFQAAEGHRELSLAPRTADSNGHSPHAIGRRLAIAALVEMLPLL